MSVHWIEEVLAKKANPKVGRSEYQHEYYLKHRDEILKKRKEKWEKEHKK